MIRLDLLLSSLRQHLSLSVLGSDPSLYLSGADDLMMS